MDGHHAARYLPNEEAFANKKRAKPRATQPALRAALP